MSAGNPRGNGSRSAWNPGNLKLKFHCHNCGSQDQLFVLLLQVYSVFNSSTDQRKNLGWKLRCWLKQRRASRAVSPNHLAPYLTTFQGCFGVIDWSISENSNTTSSYNHPTQFHHFNQDQRFPTISFISFFAS